MEDKTHPMESASTMTKSFDNTNRVAISGSDLVAGHAARASMGGSDNSYIDELSSLVARQETVREAMIMPFVDYTVMIKELLVMYASPDTCLINVGLIPPGVAQAADQAGVEIEEISGLSPFAGSIGAVFDAIGSGHDLVYLSNPNRITGTSYSLRDIEDLARRIPSGLLILDEYYYDYLGISGKPLLDDLKNIVVLRSFSAPFSIRSAEAGFIIAFPNTIDTIKRSYSGRGFSATVCKMVKMGLTNHDIGDQRLKEIHEESLRVSTSLGKLNVKARICATDFLLLQVANPREVANALARGKVAVENLSGYRNLDGFLKYEVQSPLTNDRMLDCFKRVIQTDRATKIIDSEVTRLRRPPENSGRQNQQTAREKFQSRTFSK